MQKGQLHAPMRLILHASGDGSGAIDEEELHAAFQLLGKFVMNEFQVRQVTQGFPQSCRGASQLSEERGTSTAFTAVGDSTSPCTLCCDCISVLHLPPAGYRLTRVEVAEMISEVDHDNTGGRHSGPWGSKHLSGAAGPVVQGSQGTQDLRSCACSTPTQSSVLPVVLTTPSRHDSPSSTPYLRRGG